MLKKRSVLVVGISSYFFLASPFSYGQQNPQPEKKTTTTTYEETTTQVQPAPRSTPKKVKSRSGKSATDVQTSIISTSTTTEAMPAPMVPRKPYDADTLKKISDKLCTDGFKAYVGTDKKNLCLGKASPPDIAYSCMWNKKGTPVYNPTPQGPCSLDFVEHRGSITLKGESVECCYRAAQGPAASVK